MNYLVVKGTDGTYWSGYAVPMQWARINECGPIIEAPTGDDARHLAPFAIENRDGEGWRLKGWRGLDADGVVTFVGVDGQGNQHLAEVMP